MTQHSTHDTNEMPNPGFLIPTPPSRWPIVLMTAAMLAIAAVAAFFYLQARGLQETARATAVKLNEVEVAREEAGAKHQKNLEELQKQLSDLAAKQAATEAAKPSKKSAIKADTKQGDDTITTFKVEDGLKAPRGLIGICGVPAKDQAAFLNATYRLNFGEEVYLGAEELEKLNDVHAKKVWKFRADQCPKLADATASE